MSKTLFYDYDNGISTLRIAENLKARGVCNAHDRVAWTHASIEKILENHNYLGTEYYPQIIDTELFERVQKRREQMRAENGRGSHRPGRDQRILFGGIITCGECGETCSHIQPHNKKGNKAGTLTDEQVKEVCVSAINQIIQDRLQMCPPATTKETVSAEYREIERRLEQAKARWKQSILGQKATHQEQADTDMGQVQQCTDQTDIMALLYQRAQERYRTLEINDAGFRTDEMQEILADREELTEFDEELYRRLVTRIVVYKNNTAEVVFLNRSSIKIEYQSDIL